MKKVFKVLGGLLLICLAFVIFCLTTPIAFAWKIRETIKRKENIGSILNSLSLFFNEIAASYDQLGNAVFGGFFNWLFLDNDMIIFYSFGDKDDTISEVLGWNYRINALSKTGEKIVYILNFLDKDHCEKAMQSGIKKAADKVEKSKRFKIND